MASGGEDERAGAEIVYGAEECGRRSAELLEELGFPSGVLPLKDLEECGRVRETGFVWMKQRAACEHVFEKIGTRVSYAVEVTAYVERRRMKRMTGVKSKQVFLWVPIAEMSIEDPAGKRITFRTPMGLGRSFHVRAFMTDEEDQRYLADKKKKEEEEAAAAANEESNELIKLPSFFCVFVFVSLCVWLWVGPFFVHQ